MNLKQRIRKLFGLRPGTTWYSCHDIPSLHHSSEYGHMCCRNCGQSYQMHGISDVEGKKLHIPESIRHLACP